jgi:hypothetical protein
MLGLVRARYVKKARKSDLRLNSDGALTIESLSWGRSAWMLSVQLVRIMICITLAWYGFLFTYVYMYIACIYFMYTVCMLYMYVCMYV